MRISESLWCPCCQTTDTTNGFRSDKVKREGQPAFVSGVILRSLAYSNNPGKQKPCIYVGFGENQCPGNCRFWSCMVLTIQFRSRMPNLEPYHSAWRFRSSIRIFHYHDHACSPQEFPPLLLFDGTSSKSRGGRWTAKSMWQTQQFYFGYSSCIPAISGKFGGGCWNSPPARWWSLDFNER